MDEKRFCLRQLKLKRQRYNFLPSKVQIVQTDGTQSKAQQTCRTCVRWHQPATIVELSRLYKVSFFHVLHQLYAK